MSVKCSYFSHLLDHFSLQQPGLVVDQVHPVQQSGHIGEPDDGGYQDDYGNYPNLTQYSALDSTETLILQTPSIHRTLPYPE